MSIELFEGFQFRYCWDVNNSETIRIYVEKRPQAVQNLKPEDICLNPAKDGAPEYIKIPENVHLTIFTHAQSVAYEWAKRVLNIVTVVPSTWKKHGKESS